MKHTLLGMLAGTALIAAYSIASAQDAKIMDGNNPAPNYAASSAPKPVKTVTHKAGGAHHATHHHKAHTPTG